MNHDPILFNAIDVDPDEENLVAYEDENIVRFVFDKKTSPNFFPYKGHVESFDISGRGYARDDCGEWASSYMNDAHDDIVHKRKNCHRQGCPICFRIWANRLADAAAGYLYGFLNYGKALAHWTFSVNPEWFTTWAELDKTLVSITEHFSNDPDFVLSVVRHPRRLQCGRCGAAAPTGKDRGRQRCKAKLPDAHGILQECGAFEWVWNFGPHLHLITSFAYDVSRVKEFASYMSDSHLVLKHITNIIDKKHLKRTLAYEFGHALDEHKSSPVIRYLGFSAKNHFRAERTLHHPLRLDKHDQPLYRVQERFVEFGHLDDPDSPCDFIQINKNMGAVQFDHDIYGRRIPLTELDIDYNLISLGQFVNGTWLRYAVPRAKMKKLPADRDVLLDPKTIRVRAPKSTKIGKKRKSHRVPVRRLITALGKRRLKYCASHDLSIVIPQFFEMIENA